MAPTKALYYTPMHPYTEALMSAIPPDDPELTMQPVFLEGEPPNPAHPPSGCTFHPRCRYADIERCKTEVPRFREISTGHLISCHHAESLTLTGALEYQIPVEPEGAENA